ncbi:adenosylcobinamide-phosphate synthase CbiB [Paenibacillus crassostreae]|uniref:Cobalamin biosynthesis protein CobD n=1 Tax=Paenibacillus crassostreae TaxID=1763538 RepID=A0A167GMJ5_9BACL|nr:adenosylcobinamide-phosphate synthase CbiB [Paenibacillus crassostreae]AOZ94617.1 cobalamin biosynthesis protein CobD [Paenibacillus crassostreae]OAB77717.1 adenosylcobinamide-phosphate synthase [Paenibacillus crassostreae]
MELAVFMLWAAYLLDLIIGDPRWIPHPVIGMGNGIKRLEKKIRSRVSLPADLKKVGILLPVIIVGGSFLLIWALLKGLYMIHPWIAVVAEVVFIATTIATKGLKDAGMEVYGHLNRGDLPAARKALGMIVGRDTHHLDEPEIVRGTVETVAENIVDAIVSPLFFALIGGAPLAMAYRAVNTLDSMVGYKNDKYINLGWASARLDDIANYIPARITGVLLVVSSWLMRLDYKRSVRTIKHDARLHPSPNSGFPESAVAGALGIRLGGENIYHGEVSFRAYMGEGSRPMGKEDIIATVRLMLLSSLLFLLLSVLVIVVFGGTLWR